MGIRTHSIYWESYTCLNQRSGMMRAGIFWLQNCADQGNPYAVYLLEHKDEWGRIRLRSGVIRLFHHLSALFNEQENEDHNKMHGMD